ncbi:MAG: metallophosphoesterase family protein [Chloroflexi bacterium]|nr:metallophosphoesterase family protein [Chloroflexota bacterium]
MRVALLSDIHSNLAALDAVVAAAKEDGATAWWHLGDVVGYGPDPDAVIERLGELGASGVMGNHDAAAAGVIDTSDFNPLAAEAALWTAAEISTPSRDYLAALPLQQVDGAFTRVHGSLRDPIWEYLRTEKAVRAHFALQETAFSIVGHTHFPLVIVEQPGRPVDARVPDEGKAVKLGPARACVNPGCVGQPRDGDPRACYAILDTEALTVLFRRVPYDIAATQEKMRTAGLPEPLISRLSVGR